MGLRRVVSGIFLLFYFTVAAQAATRLAIVPANSRFSEAENRIVDSLTGKLAGKEGVTIIDRASIERILREQNFQNSDRSSLDTATRIGKLVGARQIVVRGDLVTPAMIEEQIHQGVEAFLRAYAPEG